jgi:flagellar basal-body rod protein FlgB
MAVTDLPLFSMLKTRMYWLNERQRVLAENVAGSTSQFPMENRGGFETTPRGNAVVLEDEMLKVAQTQMDHQAATQLYSKSIGLIKTALGRR